ncbi:preprotein translocase subunit SecA [Tepidiphilus baoligensis]|uniref:Protein translocase subunit SecA n=1 Tax=Tepidiphilus baoligensis TaxID=2698687 RepID=A0ABX1QK70_9PROT|nr:preprotein translocase subunit SecA [Tepidiphilus baoligensis]NMH16368.1 preprotein translocase subunit SecA [Tepidiphilus baoligensis]
MITRVLKKLFGSRNDRLLRRYRAIVARINELEPSMAALSDEALRAKTAEFRQRHANGESLDALLPEAYAVVREAGKRVHGMRHFDVQLIGGIVLHEGKIAEMRTGEGKTLVATLPAYLNALTGKGVHVITVNDYLARRDSDWMGRIYRFLGLTVGCNVPGLSHGEKHEAYAADITYGTNNEFGFDYLRDNMVYAPVDRVQRGLHYAIVDEVDSILIDEARTPLIISGQAEDNTELYLKMNEVVPLLTEQKMQGEEVLEPGDYTIDLKARQVLLTEQGHEKVEGILMRMGLLPEGGNLYDPRHITLLHHLYAALRAHALFHRDQHYVVQDDEIIIVDEFTGRLMPGRRWSEGLHQAIEAKEGVRIQAENQTLASITFQNYFRMYEKLAGMTGTADTEAYEFQQIYGLETVIIPTNRPLVRRDENDRVYRTAKEKWQAVIEDIKECRERGQPVLVGTTSIEVNEFLSKLLTKEKIPHQILNAKQHEREAHIIAQAGRPGMVTIATNMAGRGTDIVLGGNIAPQIEAIENDPSLSDEEKEKRIEALRAEWQKAHDAVIAAGGLRIIGTERHESRRIDNQLRGRAGRQGDPGSSRFYLSLEDPLLRIFAGDRLNAIMVRLKMPEGEAIEHPMVTRSLESAQRRVEQHNFDIRKQLLEYDDVANEQRKVIYAQRNEVVDAEDVSELVADMRAGVLVDVFRTYVPADSVEEQWDLAGLEQTLAGEFNLQLPLRQWLEAEPELSDEQLLDRLLAEAEESYRTKVSLVDPQAWKQFERSILLQSIDTHWREHLSALDHLRQGIHLRGYAQKNPKQEYKREAFELFEAMLDAIRRDVSRILLSVQVRTEAAVEEVVERPPEVQDVHYLHGESAAEEGETAVKARPQTNVLPKVGRNDPCPCGSGKKYKHCHGKLN